jgi:hypothetical protein
VSAQAVGSANEGEHFPQMLNETLSNIDEAGLKRRKRTKPVMLADKNYFSEENLKACKGQGGGSGNSRQAVQTAPWK